ncbi:MAG: hypothetical protein KDA89_19320, partial [Planctomycetaceae bacterium]|nr:hypothetical protein [Planctomycetaceae bacterium]
MKHSVRRKLDAKKRRHELRIKNQHSHMRSPMLRCPKTKLELSNRISAVNCGGLSLVQSLVNQVGL